MDKKLINIVKEVILNCLDIKKKYQNKNKKYYYDKNLKKEIKSDIDIKIEKLILNVLKKTNINILSEEKGFIKLNSISEKFWVLDPIDGTFNYIHNIGPSSISLALIDNNQPIFGIIGLYPEMKIVYGGKTIDSYYNNKKISVSNNSDTKKSVLFTGFPSRFSFKSKSFVLYKKLFSKFKKVRMIGSASYSIFNVAIGKADYYYEDSIMIWDVAAALAILQGAGGDFKIIKKNKSKLICVHAFNRKLKVIK